MKKTIVLSLFAVLAVGVIFSASIASAYRGNYDIPGPSYDEERHDAIEDALESNDYDAWYDLMTEDGRHPGIVDVVTEDNFETFVQAHDAMEDGDQDTASALRTELGIGEGNGLGHRQGHGKGRGYSHRMHQNNFADVDNDGVCDNLGSGFSRHRN